MVRGLVDFPALVDGKEVYLCWKLGEPEVLFWHDMDAGFAGRQSLTAMLVWIRALRWARALRRARYLSSSPVD